MLQRDEPEYFAIVSGKEGHELFGDLSAPQEWAQLRSNAIIRNLPDS